jgi:hypothetical protein
MWRALSKAVPHAHWSHGERTRWVRARMICECESVRRVLSGGAGVHQRAEHITSAANDTYLCPRARARKLTAGRRRRILGVDWPAEAVGREPRVELRVGKDRDDTHQACEAVRAEDDEKAQLEDGESTVCHTGRAEHSTQTSLAVRALPRKGDTRCVRARVQHRRLNVEGRMYARARGWRGGGRRHVHETLSLLSARLMTRDERTTVHVAQLRRGWR